MASFMFWHFFQSNVNTKIEKFSIIRYIITMSIPTVSSIITL